MSIAPSITAGPFIANGSQTAFPFTMTLAASGELYVQVNGSTISSSLYAVALNADGTGTVNFSSPPANGASVLIVSAPDFTAETVFSTEGDYRLDQVNAINRRDGVRANWLARLITKLLPSGWETPANIAGKYLAFDASGNPVVASGTGNDTALRSDIAAASGAGLIGFLQAGTGAVTRTLQSRMRDAINVKDFGAVGDGLTNDTAAVQAAINYAQAIKAWVYFPATLYAYMVTGLTIGQTGTNYTCHFVGGGFDPSMAAQTGITGQYSGQSMLKLIAGSNTSLITVNADAAQPMFVNMTFNGNGSAQTGTSYCINFADASAAAYYRYAGWMRDCLVTAGKTGGLFIGTNRGAGYYENVWVQYCGTANTDSAINVRCFDQQFRACQVGPNPGVGMYLGTVTQIQVSDSVLFQNTVGMQVTSGVGHLQVANSCFDSNATYGVDLVGNGATDGGRIFNGCHWRRNSTLTNNTYSDIRIDSDRRITLIGPVFGGKETNTSVVKYCIETLSTTQAPYVRVLSPIYEVISGTPYGTAFASSTSALMLTGSRDAYIGKIGGNQSISGVVNDLERWRTDNVGTKFLATLYAPKDDGTLQTNSATYAGSGVPSNSNGNNGDFYFRSDTPGTANQRLYVKSAGAWVGIL